MYTCTRLRMGCVLRRKMEKHPRVTMEQPRLQAQTPTATKNLNGPTVGTAAVWEIGEQDRPSGVWSSCSFWQPAIRTIHICIRSGLFFPACSCFSPTHSPVCPVWVSFRSQGCPCVEPVAAALTDSQPPPPARGYLVCPSPALHCCALGPEGPKPRFVRTKPRPSLVQPGLGNGPL